MRRLTLLEMSEFVNSLVTMQRSTNGLSAKTYIILEPADSATLRIIADSLGRMAPYADSIRRMIQQAEKNNG